MMFIKAQCDGMTEIRLVSDGFALSVALPLSFHRRLEMWSVYTCDLVFFCSGTYVDSHERHNKRFIEHDVGVDVS